MLHFFGIQIKKQKMIEAPFGQMVRIFIRTTFVLERRQKKEQRLRLTIQRRTVFQ